MANDIIRPFSSISKNDLAIVGGKNASLGEMFSQLSGKGVPVPDGFAVTADAFREFIAYNKLALPLAGLMQALDRSNFQNLPGIAAKAREHILTAAMPGSIKTAIARAYHELVGNAETEVAVRSSATAEDLPGASFAGLHESFLNVEDEDMLLDRVQKCFASLYTDRAIKYREDKGFRHDQVFLSVGVQKMVRADRGCSGVAFTLEPESGFRDIIHISGVWGLGENMVQGTVCPDEFYVFKTMLAQGKQGLVRKKLGSKEQMMVYGHDRNKLLVNTPTPPELRSK